MGLVHKLKSGPLGEWVQQRARGGRQGSRFAATALRLHDGVKQGGFRFCLILRLSPLPSWVANYVLPLSGVPLHVYIPTSLLGILPPLCANVYQGMAAASLVSSLSGGDGHGGSSSMGLLTMVACQWLMGLVLAKETAQFATRGDEPNAA